MNKTTEKHKTEGTGSAPKLSLKEHIFWMWDYWRPHKYLLVFMAAFTLLSTAVTVAYPLVFRTVIDRVSGIFESGTADASIRGIMLILGAILVGHFISRLYPATRAMVNARLERDIRDDVFGQLMTKDYHFGNAFRTGDVVTRLTDDIAEWPKVSWFACSGIFRAVESSFKLIFCLGAMLIMNPKLTGLSVIPLPIMMWIFYTLRHRMSHYMEESQKYVSTTNNILESVFSGIRIVKAFSAEDAQSRRLSMILRERVEILMGLVKLQVVLFSLDTFATRLGQMVVIVYGGFLVMSGELSVGTLFAFYVYLDILTGPMMDIPFLFMTGQQAFISIDRVEEIRAFPVTEQRSSGTRLDDVHEIALERVSFSYDRSRRVLSDISLRVSKGQRIAVVGPIASGKSTMLKLLAGIISPDEGRVLINGRPLGDWDWDTYRLEIGYVPQEALLFSQSIEENVSFGRTPPEDGPLDSPSPREWAEYCLSMAQMDSDIAALPAGMDTVAGQKGELVSGGQKQRIAIARALAGRPGVLLLDDCTAALDARNEDRFWTRLDSEYKDSVCFVVSHRLTTIRRADSIVVLDDGYLVDSGTHDELVGRCETYREFLQTERKKERLRATGRPEISNEQA